MQLCPAANLTSCDEVDELAQWAQNAFDYLVRTTHTVVASTASTAYLLTARAAAASQCTVPMDCHNVVC